MLCLYLQPLETPHQLQVMAGPRRKVMVNSRFQRAVGLLFLLAFWLMPSRAVFTCLRSAATSEVALWVLNARLWLIDDPEPVSAGTSGALRDSSRSKASRRSSSCSRHMISSDPVHCR